MSFGLSGNSQSTSMDNADPVVAWTDNSGQPQAVDYHLSGRFQVRPNYKPAMFRNSMYN